MALVRDDCLVPTLDALELGYIRESTPEQYVPDVFYKVRMDSSVSLALSQRLRPEQSGIRTLELDNTMITSWHGFDSGI